MKTITLIPVEREIETGEFYETVRNIMDNEYLTDGEKEVVNKLVNHYKLQMASTPLYTTESIKEIEDVLSNLYDKLLVTDPNECAGEVESIEADIAYYEERLCEENEELISHLKDENMWMKLEVPNGEVCC